MDKEQLRKLLKELADSKVKVRHLSTKLDRIENIIHSEDFLSKDKNNNVSKETEEQR
jgi:valyl-tRNA synthetase